MSYELTEERKAEIDKEPKQKLEFVLREYWRVRNGKARFMRCPYCMKGTMMRRNWPNRSICCALFARAFKAILDRQDKVDEGMRERITERLFAN